MKRVPTRVRVASRCICGWFGLRVRRMCDLMARAVPEAWARRCGIGRIANAAHSRSVTASRMMSVMLPLARPCFPGSGAAGRNPFGDMVGSGGAGSPDAVGVPLLPFHHPGQDTELLGDGMDIVSVPAHGEDFVDGCEKLRRQLACACLTGCFAQVVHRRPAGSPFVGEGVHLSVQWVFDRTDMDMCLDDPRSRRSNGMRNGGRGLYFRRMLECCMIYLRIVL